jgi:multisubunit Na+/H+ antiporter MnhG subunit
VSILMPEATSKLLALSIFIIFSGPVASHAIAVAVKRADLPLEPRQEQASPLEKINESDATQNA